MFQILAFVASYLPWLLLLALAALIWLRRRRGWWALPALVALVLVLLLHAREILYAAGMDMFELDIEPGLHALWLPLAKAVSWYNWQVMAFATFAAALLAWPLPEGRGQRLLALAVVLGLGASALLAWAFTGLRFI